mmetsp:Transcript_2548/g.4454  ORF Transcript_2548/g.4454 Transcript_2548/m.4454 type:complete len:494 (+) Transcript_2548:655-2136(+)
MANAVEVNMDATGLAALLENPTGSLNEDGELIYDPFVITRMALAMRGTAYLTQRDTLTVQIQLASRDRRVVGRNFLFLLRHQFSSHAFAESSMIWNWGRRGQTGIAGFGVKFWRQLSERSSAIWESSFSGKGFQMSIGSTRQLTPRVTGQLTWAAGASPGVSCNFRRMGGERVQTKSMDAKNEDRGMTEVELQNSGFWRRKYHRLMHPAAVQCGARMNPGEAAITASIKRGIGSGTESCGEDGGYLKLKGDIGTTGWDLEASGGRVFLVRDLSFGIAVAVGSEGLMMRFKVGIGSHRLTIPVLLSSETNTFAAVALWCSLGATAGVIQTLVVRPVRKHLKRLHLKHERERRGEAMQRARKEALETLDLMTIAISRSRERESAEEHGGLLIQKALYGARSRVLEATVATEVPENAEIEMELIDVTEAVQYLVEDSQLHFYSSPKMSLSGFWDPVTSGEDRSLRIWYEFRREDHECVLDETEEISLPLARHRKPS